MQIFSLRFPFVPLSPQIIIAIGALNGYTPTFVDAILLLRLYAVFPRQQTTRTKFFAVMAFPVLVKVARVINASIYIANFARGEFQLVKDSGVGGAQVLQTLHLPCVKIEWFLQVFDDV